MTDNGSRYAEEFERLGDEGTQSVRVTVDMLRRMCAEPEPSTEGTWFLVSLEDLRAAGHTHIEFHFADETTTPNDAALHTINEECR